MFLEVKKKLLAQDQQHIYFKKVSFKHIIYKIKIQLLVILMKIKTIKMS